MRWKGTTAALLLILGCDDPSLSEHPSTGGSGTLGFGPRTGAPFTGPSTPATDEVLQAHMGLPGLKAWHVVTNPKALPPGVDVRNRLVGMVTGKGHYMLEFDAAEVGRAFHNLYGGDAAPPGARHLRGWSDGTDNRVRNSWNGTPIVPEAGQVVSNLGMACSGQLIGHRIVRTAAHCIVQHTTSGAAYSSQMTFLYRMDAGTFLTGPVQMTYYYGGAYVPNGCANQVGGDYWAGYRANFDACTWADWGQIILNPTWDSSTGSQWFGYQGLVAGDLDNRVLNMVGYPSCGPAERPIQGSGCVAMGQYVDTSSACRIKAWTSGTWKFRSNCDVWRSRVRPHESLPARSRSVSGLHHVRTVRSQSDCTELLHWPRHVAVRLPELASQPVPLTPESCERHRRRSLPTGPAAVSWMRRTSCARGASSDLQSARR